MGFKGNKTGILAYRLDIDEEFQGWILAMATLSVFYLFCLPAACAGASCEWCRVLAARLRRHLPVFYFCISVFNIGFMYLVVTWMPDWEPADYAKVISAVLKEFAAHMVTYATSLAEIVAAVFVFLLWDKICLLLNIKSTRIFRCRFRDIGHVLCCWASPKQPVELVFWKAEELKSGTPFTANNVFAEVHYGYNEVMKTRVHDNAGSSCIFKETIQINFDPSDEDEKLVIFVKSQKMVGIQELGRYEMSCEEVKKMLNASRQSRNANEVMKYGDALFKPTDLHSRGKVWFRIDEFSDETPSAFSDLGTC